MPAESGVGSKVELMIATGSRQPASAIHFSWWRRRAVRAPVADHEGGRREQQGHDHAEETEALEPGPSCSGRRASGRHVVERGVQRLVRGEARRPGWAVNETTPSQATTRHRGDGSRPSGTTKASATSGAKSRGQACVPKAAAEPGARQVGLRQRRVRVARRTPRRSRTGSAPPTGRASSQPMTPPASRSTSSQPDEERHQQAWLEREGGSSGCRRTSRSACPTHRSRSTPRSTPSPTRPRAPTGPSSTAPSWRR